jgi:hypothetical protein
MSKVIKAYSLDLKTVRILENYCAASDNWKKTISRSKVVNDAIVWFLQGDTAELLHSSENLQEKFAEAMRKLHGIDQEPDVRPWWKRILGLR